MLKTLKDERARMCSQWDDEQNAYQDEKIRMVAKFIADLREEVILTVENAINTSNESALMLRLAIALDNNGIKLEKINPNLQKFLKISICF